MLKVGCRLTPSTAQFRVGTALILAGAVYDEQHEKLYFFAIGRSLADQRHILEQFTWTYIGVIPLVILSGCLLGWFLAARALEKGARVLGPNGKAFTPDNVGMALGMRELNRHLREVTGGQTHHAGFSAKENIVFSA